MSAAALDLPIFHRRFQAWIDAGQPALERACEPLPVYAERVGAMRDLLGVLYQAGWARHGWSPDVGGVGGTIAHRAAMWQLLAAAGVTGMTVFEHLEVLAPTLDALAPRALASELLPAFLSGRELWAQGFSEPDAGSDLASLRTVARRDGDDYVITGRKIWTSFAAWARWCLVLARTGTAESRHRGITAFVVDLDDPRVQVSPIVQANGTDELAEVEFDRVRVGADRIVGQLDGGWSVAMHILSHERGTFAWFRHGFLQHQLRAVAGHAEPRHHGLVGEALSDLFATGAASRRGIASHAEGRLLGPHAAFTKLLLCAAERRVHDAVLAIDPDVALGALDAHTELQRQEYLFSRIVTIYGGSQQMQLDTIAKQVLELG